MRAIRQATLGGPDVLELTSVLVGVSSGTDKALPAAAGRVRVAYLLVEPDGAALDAMASLVDSGRLRVHVSRTFALADAARAHEAGEAGRVHGKLVLTVG